VPRKFEFSPPGAERRNPEEVKANEAKIKDDAFNSIKFLRNLSFGDSIRGAHA
jgi:hypothetical protein